MKHYADPIAAVAAKQGRASRAWLVDLDGWRASGFISKSNGSAPLRSWIVEAPWAHPAWHSYWLSLIHLRPLEGFPPPIIHRPGATHELVILAMDPDKPRDAVIRSGPVPFLEPANFIAQLVEPDDEAAIARADDTVDRILAGTLNPDTDAMWQWIEIFGDHCIKPAYRR